VLGLQPGASAQEVRHAYIDLVKKWHPDRFAQKSARDQTVAQEKLKEINEAYSFLRDHRAWQVPPVYHSGGATGEWKEYRRYADYEPPIVDPFEGDYQYRPVRGSRANPVVWVMAFIFLANAFQWVTGWNVFTGRLPNQQSVQASPRPGNTVRTPIATASLGGVGVDQSQAKPQRLPYFFIGSTKADVYRLQGMPNWANDSEWRYGSSRVYFTGPMVARWESRPDAPLNAIALPSVDTQSLISVGSTTAEVLAIMGAPTSLKDNYWAYPHDQVVKTTYWQYGNSQIEFSEGKVIGWKEVPGAPLKVSRGTVEGKKMSR